MGRLARKPFNVFEAGHGRKPAGLVEQAKKANTQGRPRKFTGVDLEKTELEGLLTEKQAELLKRAGTLHLIQGNAVEELRKLKPESQDLIFDSHTFHHFSLQESQEYLRLAREKLKKGGHLVMVNSIIIAEEMKENARKYGFEFHYYKLSEEKAKASPSESIRELATDSDRVKKLQEILQRFPYDNVAAEYAYVKAKQQGLIKTPQDSLMQVVFMLKKPRK